MQKRVAGIVLLVSVLCLYGMTFSALDGWLQSVFGVYVLGQVFLFSWSMISAIQRNEIVKAIASEVIREHLEKTYEES